MISLHSLADLPQEVVVGVPGVELHVVPEVDRDAAVGLAEVVEPQARQVQHVASIHPHVERVGILKSNGNGLRFILSVRSWVGRSAAGSTWPGYGTKVVR